MSTIKARQLDLSSILAHADLTWSARLNTYAGLRLQDYVSKAANITPQVYDKETVYRRFAFAICSVQSNFEVCSRVYKELCKLTWKQRQSKRKVKATIKELIYHEVKTRGLIELAAHVEFDYKALLRGHEETWQDYRKRLTSLHGLGKAKATFAACLLYPLTADLACLDTWLLQHVGLPASKNGKLTWQEYCKVEDHIRGYARQWGVNTFVAQWIVWDHERGTEQGHEVIAFPGQHKGG